MKHSGITERRDRHGRIRFQVRVRRGSGYQTATLPTLAEALAWRAQALAAADGAAEPPSAPGRAKTLAPVLERRTVTVEETARRLCRGMVDGTIRTRDGLPFKPSVARKYEAALRLHVLPRIGTIPVATLTMGDVQRLVDEIAAYNTAEVGRRSLTALRVALRVAVRYGELQANPCSGVRVPTNPDGEKPARILTPEETAAIVAAAFADDARLGRSFAGPLVSLALSSGLRIGELLALRYGGEGLDLDAGVVHVRANLDRVRDATSGHFPELAPKSRASRRDVPLSADEVALLRRHRLATGRPRDGALVFGGRQGQSLSPVPAHRAFKRASRAAFTAIAQRRLDDAQRAGGAVAIEQAQRLVEEAASNPLPRLHDLRHAFATHALAAGLSAHAVAALLGHSDAGLVWRRYGHALPDELATAGERLNAWRRARAEGS